MIRKGLSGNQLKVLALVAMTCDHVGKYLLPQWKWLQIFGRLAFPIFAYMIAEGCIHTKDRKRYIGLLALTAAICQAVYLFVIGSLYQSIMVTFTLSVLQIYAIDYANEQQSLKGFLTLLFPAVGIYVLTVVMPEKVPGFYIDYGFWGVMLPVIIYCTKGKWQKLIMTGLVLAVQAIYSESVIQGYALLAVPVLAFYNGTRGTYRLKYLFYLYYPLHLAALHILKICIER